MPTRLPRGGSGEADRPQRIASARDLHVHDERRFAEQDGGDAFHEKGQFSRWVDGVEGIKWDKLVCLMDACGNDARLQWMLHQRGYDLRSLHARESELERELRSVREELAALKVKREIELGLMREIRA